MKLSKIIIGIVLSASLLLAISYVLTKRSIEKSLIEICDAAAEKYDCLPRKALLLQLSDQTTGTEQMNQTIWAIGKMKMDMALPKLETMLDACNEPSYQYYKCTYELKKTIGYLKDGKIDLMSFSELNK